MGGEGVCASASVCVVSWVVAAFWEVEEAKRDQTWILWQGKWPWALGLALPAPLASQGCCCYCWEGATHVGTECTFPAHPITTWLSPNAEQGTYLRLFHPSHSSRIWGLLAAHWPLRIGFPSTVLERRGIELHFAVSVCSQEH